MITSRRRGHGPSVSEEEMLERNKRANMTLEEEHEYDLTLEELRKQLWVACQSVDIHAIKKVYRKRILGEDEFADCLSWTIEENNLEVASCLLGLGADPNKAFHSDIFGLCSLDLLKLLVKYGWDVQRKGLELLVERVKDRPIVEYLLEFGLDLNTPSRNENIRYEVEHDDTAQCLNRAAAHGDIEMFDYLVSKGADPSRSIALHTGGACKEPQRTIKMIVHLIEKYGFEINADDLCGGLRSQYGLGGQYQKDRGETIDCAMYYGNHAAIEALLWYGADPDRILSHAIFKGSVAIVKTLLEAGADATRGAFVAIEESEEEILNLCVSYGAKEEVYSQAVPKRYESSGSESEDGY